jgi:hypothetical protein
LQEVYSALDIRLGNCCGRGVFGRGLDRHVRHDSGDIVDADAPARNGHGGMADRERIQSICNRFSICKTSDERAFERRIELQGEIKMLKGDKK